MRKEGRHRRGGRNGKPQREVGSGDRQVIGSGVVGGVVVVDK
jgi:hypothetical protein